MYIKRINGKEVTTYWAIDELKNIVLNPGTHKFHIAFESDGVTAEEIINYELLANHLYEIYAIKTGESSFKVYLADMTGEKEKILYTTDTVGHCGQLNKDGNLNALINEYTIQKYR